MDVISQISSSTISSTLNPNAPMFVPLAYRSVEDFSDQWWSLVQSSPWFRDYWLQERFHDPQNDSVIQDSYDSAFSDIYSLFDDDMEEDMDDKYQYQLDVVEKDLHRELITLGSPKWRKAGLADSPRYAAKAPKIVNVKLSPRMIQQPR